jgi:hypothetical protein
MQTEIFMVCSRGWFRADRLRTAVVQPGQLTLETA